MKYAIAVALGLSVSTASAEVPQSDIDAMFDMMQDFGTSLEKGTTAAFFDATMHPAVWVEFARSIGRPTETFKVQSIAMMEQYYATLDISDFDILTDTAQFGTSRGWNWGMIGAQSVVRENNGPAETDCVTMLIFGMDGDWFISEASPQASPLLVAAVPAMSAVDFSYDACLTGGS